MEQAVQRDTAAARLAKGKPQPNVAADLAGGPQYLAGLVLVDPDRSGRVGVLKQPGGRPAAAIDVFAARYTITLKSGAGVRMVFQLLALRVVWRRLSLRITERVGDLGHQR